jgi:nucleotide-binding universal stress UspA family protein
MMILLAYDGSLDAQAALDHAARLLPGADVTVLTVWESFPSAAGGGLMGMGSVYLDPVEVDQANEESAKVQASEGADRARAAGLHARACTTQSRAVAGAAILSAAARVNAEAIFMGTRGLTGLKSFFLGSVSHAVLQHADRPVVVVPSQQVASDRREWIHRDVAS